MLETSKLRMNMNTNVEGIICILDSLRFIIQDTRMKKRLVIKNNDTTNTATYNLFINKKNVITKLIRKYSLTDVRGEKVLGESTRHVPSKQRISLVT